jgi:hypothetical protein
MSLAEAAVPDNVLQPTRPLESTDPRDKIYALMGVWSKSPQELERLKLDRDSSVDYSKSVREIYTDFTNRVILADNNLAPLVTAGIWHPAHGPDIGIPSWVPDLRGSSGVDIRFLAFYHLGWFNASSRRPCYFDLSLFSGGTRDFILGVEGVIVDTVHKEVQNMKTDALVEVGKLGPSQAHPTGLPQLRVFFSTMIFEHQNFLSGLTEDERAANWDWMKRLLFGFCRELEDFNSSHQHTNSLFDIPLFLDIFYISHRGHEGGIRSDILEMPSLAGEYAKLREDENEIEAFRTEYLNRCGYGAADTSSSFFIAEKNNIGIGPSACEAGDSLAVLSGCPTPLVLRKAKGPQRAGPDTYQVVGPCYLYGMMNGEAFQTHREVKRISLI